MHIFIDESGDCGMRRESSSDYFAITAILVATPEAVEACETAIREVRESLGLPENYEFHFGRIKDRHRRSFLRQIAKCDFAYVACYLEKAAIQGERWHDKSYFYEKVVGALADACLDFLIAAPETASKPRKAKIIADDNKDPAYFKILRERFRQRRVVGKPLVEKVRPGRSNSVPMLQLSDMVCGAVVRSYAGEKDYLDLLQSRRGKKFKLFEKKEDDP